jgi:uncharacterized protein with GYD domain
MIFISLVKFTRKPKKEDGAEVERMFAEQAKMGIKNIGTYWTFGRYDAVRIYEAPDEETAMKGLLMSPDRVMTETLVAMKREDAQRLIE